MFEARKGLQGELPNSFKSASYPHCLVGGVWQVWASAFHKKLKALAAESASSYFHIPALPIILAHYSANIYQVPIFCNGSPLQYSCLENPMDGGAW